MKFIHLYTQRSEDHSLRSMISKENSNLLIEYNYSLSNLTECFSDIIANIRKENKDIIEPLALSAECQQTIKETNQFNSEIMGMQCFDMDHISKYINVMAFKLELTQTEEEKTNIIIETQEFLKKLNSRIDRNFILKNLDIEIPADSIFYMMREQLNCLLYNFHSQEPICDAYNISIKEKLVKHKIITQGLNNLDSKIQKLKEIQLGNEPQNSKEIIGVIARILVNIDYIRNGIATSNHHYNYRQSTHNSTPLLSKNLKVFVPLLKLIYDDYQLHIKEFLTAAEDEYELLTDDKRLFESFKATISMLYPLENTKKVAFSSRYTMQDLFDQFIQEKSARHFNHYNDLLTGLAQENRQAPLIPGIPILLSSLCEASIFEPEVREKMLELMRAVSKKIGMHQQENTQVILLSS